MPNYRVPLTVKLSLYMYKNSDGNNTYSLDSVPCDWNMLCIFCGFRLCEHLQNASNKKQPLASAYILPLALIFHNLTFLGVDRHTITLLTLTLWHHATFVFLLLFVLYLDLNKTWNLILMPHTQMLSSYFDMSYIMIWITNGNINCIFVTKLY